jgi:flagellar biosynthesis protein FlhA
MSAAALKLSNLQQVKSGRDMGFAVCVVIILTAFFLPVPAFLIDIGLAFSISLSVLILMVALWITKPLDFSAFPTVLLLATLLRLSLNVATTRLILSKGSEGYNAAGHVVGGFSQFVMNGDFVIGVIVFVILLTVNFMVIVKGSSRIAEVGARFTLDAIPGKQMAIDADLSAGIIDDREARQRRLELEQESAFFGAMDGASKFVRGDAIAGIIITAVNVFGGMVIGVTRHQMSFSQASDIYTKLSIGDGLVSQIPALIISLAAGLLVSKGGNKGSAQEAIVDQLGGYPRALSIASILVGLMSLMPGLPFLPFAAISGLMSMAAFAIPKKRKENLRILENEKKSAEQNKSDEDKNSVKEFLRTSEIELCLGKQLASVMLVSHGELAHRVAKMRKKFAQLYGFVVPEIQLSDDFIIPPKSYVVKIHGSAVASFELRIGEVMVLPKNLGPPDLPCDETKEPAFGMDAYWVQDVFSGELKRAGFTPIDTMSIMLTHISETIRNNLSQLLSYKDMRALIDRLEPEYKKLMDETCPALISFSGFQSILKLLLAERVSIRNIHLILEAVAEIAPHVRKPEAIVEHVRIRISQQICGDLAQDGVLKVIRLGSKWDLAFHQSLKRDGKGEVVEFDIDPRLIEQFARDSTAAFSPHLEKGERIVLVCAPEARAYVRMIVDRLFPNLPVLSHVEIARGVRIDPIGSIS